MPTRQVLSVRQTHAFHGLQHSVHAVTVTGKPQALGEAK